MDLGGHVFSVDYNMLFHLNNLKWNMCYVLCCIVLYYK